MLSIALGPPGRGDLLSISLFSSLYKLIGIPLASLYAYTTFFLFACVSQTDTQLACSMHEGLIGTALAGVRHIQLSMNAMVAGPSSWGPAFPLSSLYSSSTSSLSSALSSSFDIFGLGSSSS